MSLSNRWVVVFHFYLQLLSKIVVVRLYSFSKSFMLVFWRTSFFFPRFLLLDFCSVLQCGQKKKHYKHYGNLSSVFLLVVQIFPLIFICLYFIFFYFFNLVFIYFVWERESANREGEEREGDTESETDSRLWAVSKALDAGLKPTNHEIVTSVEFGRLTYQATEAPHFIFSFSFFVFIFSLQN